MCVCVLSFLFTRLPNCCNVIIQVLSFCECVYVCTKQQCNRVQMPLSLFQKKKQQLFETKEHTHTQVPRYNRHVGRVAWMKHKLIAKCNLDDEIGENDVEQRRDGRPAFDMNKVWKRQNLHWKLSKGRTGERGGRTEGDRLDDKWKVTESKILWNGTTTTVFCCLCVSRVCVRASLLGFDRAIIQLRLRHRAWSHNRFVAFFPLR